MSVCLTVWCHHSHTISVLSHYTVTDMSLSVCMLNSMVSSQSHYQYYRTTQSLICHSVSVCLTVWCHHSHTSQYYRTTQSLTCHSLSVCLTVWCHHSHTISVLSHYTFTDMSLSVCMLNSLVSSQSHYLSIIALHSH